MPMAKVSQRKDLIFINADIYIMAQILTYLKLSGCKLGLLANFNVRHLRDGIKRIIL
ncbi:MAG: GxxExxY protein [Bacteroidales bacterium]|nr:GxxExxY protein [Bacteroidales bacterium]